MATNKQWPSTAWLLLTVSSKLDTVGHVWDTSVQAATEDEDDGDDSKHDELDTDNL